VTSWVSAAIDQGTCAAACQICIMRHIITFALGIREWLVDPAGLHPSSFKATFGFYSQVK